LRGGYRAAAVRLTLHQKGRFTVKKLLAMSLVAGILGLTTGCPATETKAPSKTTPSGTTTTHTEKDKGGKMETKTESKPDGAAPAGKTEPKTEKKTEEKK
jgi:hypothetical protein